MQKGRSRSSSLFDAAWFCLVGPDFSQLSRAVQTGEVEDDTEVALGHTSRRRPATQRTDERKPVTILEPSLGDEVTLEAVGSIVKAVCGCTDRATTTAENIGEDLTGRDDCASLRSRRSRAIRASTEVEERDGTLLWRCTESERSTWVERSVRNRDTCVKAGRRGDEREQDVASALHDFDEIQRS